MDVRHVFSLAVFGSYFLAIIVLFFLIISNLSSSSKTSSNGHLKPALFVVLTIGSLCHTWFYMFKYMEWSFNNYESSLRATVSHDFISRVGSWLWNTSLFEEAWATVCRHPMNWWWSEQLCLFTAGAWTIFIAVEGKRYNIKHLWAYMLLGQIVAISVAANLFYLACLLAQPPTLKADRRSAKAGPMLWLSVLLSLVTVAISPMTSQQTFLPNLLVMHALLFAPLLPRRATSTLSPKQGKTNEEAEEERFSIHVNYLYRFVQLASAAIHIRTALTTVKYLQQGSFGSNIAEAAWKVLHSHPAQSSIGWDVVWTSISFAVWIATRPAHSSQSSKPVTLSYLLLATPIASVGVTAPYVLQSKRNPSEIIDVKEE
ncbi:hypothetical protein M413DRAFT_445929 [Hebeloma cylindrosporum]|uniref:Uncharacterized protein n=1 Tax=Hebeloma cylindrosporum TaxID=76867 RepID=A0A0C2XRY6_HEBCY|nr:hypothetical protein M413DRAFT_445929 [Hebeloma cylindrosporum h7]